MLPFRFSWKVSAERRRFPAKRRKSIFFMPLIVIPLVFTCSNPSVCCLISNKALLFFWKLSKSEPEWTSLLLFCWFLFFSIKSYLWIRSEMSLMKQIGDKTLQELKKGEECSLFAKRTELLFFVCPRSSCREFPWRKRDEKVLLIQFYFAFWAWENFSITILQKTLLFVLLYNYKAIKKVFFCQSSIFFLPLEFWHSVSSIDFLPV